MDIVAHGLWSYIIFHAKRYWKWAVFIKQIIGYMYERGIGRVD